MAVRRLSKDQRKAVREVLDRWLQTSEAEDVVLTAYKFQLSAKRMGNSAGTSGDESTPLYLDDKWFEEGTRNSEKSVRRAKKYLYWKRRKQGVVDSTVFNMYESKLRGLGVVPAYNNYYPNAVNLYVNGAFYSKFHYDSDSGRLDNTDTDIVSNVSYVAGTPLIFRLSKRTIDSLFNYITEKILEGKLRESLLEGINEAVVNSLTK